MSIKVGWREYGRNINGDWTRLPDGFVVDGTSNSRLIIALLDEIERLQPPSDCGWEWEPANSLWLTGCQQEFESIETDEACELYEYCPFCGGKIIVEVS